MRVRCAKCGCVIHGFITGKKYIDNKVHCSECYYNELGKVVELYPIGMPVFDPSTFLVNPNTIPSKVMEASIAEVNSNKNKNPQKNTPIKQSRFESIIQ